MKKLLLSLITILLLTLTGITIAKGTTIVKFKVLGIKEIKAKNLELDNLLVDATKLAGTDYRTEQENLKNAMSNLNKEKAKYEDMLNLTSEDDVSLGIQTQYYDIDFLWIRLGNHAKSEGVNLNVSATDIVEDTTLTTNLTSSRELEQTDENSNIQNEKKYNSNFNFTVVGSYIGISNFIENIESDSELGFKIENFVMKPSSESSDILQATFICKDIIIKGISTSTISASESTNYSNASSTNTSSSSKSSTNKSNVTNSMADSNSAAKDSANAVNAVLEE